MHRKFDDSFKIMAVDLSVVRGSVADVAKELDIDPSLLSKWRRNPRYNGNKVLPDNPKISPEEQELRVLRKELSGADQERRLPFYRGDKDPDEHVRAFYIALASAKLSPGEKGADS